MEYLADPPPETFAWAPSLLSDGLCVALVKDSHPTLLLPRLLADPAVGPAPADKVRAWAELETARAASTGNYGSYATAIEAGRVSDWVVVIELNGYRATEERVLADISLGTVATVMYGNVNAGRAFMYAEDGRVTRQFDPLHTNYCDNIGTKLAEEQGLPFGVDGQPDVSMLRLAARLTGIVLTPQILADSSSRTAVGWFPLLQ